MWSRPPLRHGSPLEQPDDRHERRVQQWDGEHEERQEQRRHRRARDGPARGEAERPEGEAEQLAAAVAHEHGRGPSQPEVVRKEAETSEADAEREHGDHVVGVDRERVDGEERARDRRE